MHPVAPATGKRTLNIWIDEDLHYWLRTTQNFQTVSECVESALRQVRAEFEEEAKKKAQVAAYRDAEYGWDAHAEAFDEALERQERHD